MQLRGRKLLVYPKEEETIDTFWAKVQEHPFPINELEVSSVYIGFALADRLVQVLQSQPIRKVTLRPCGAPPRIWDRLLANLTNIKHLEVIRPTDWVHVQSSAIAQLHRLISLSINHDKNLTVFFEGMKDLAQLRELKLNGSRLSQADIDAFLSYLQSPSARLLRKLSLTCCQLDDCSLGNVLEALQSLPHLHQLDLVANQCGPRSIQALGDPVCDDFPIFPHLKRLDLSYQYDLRTDLTPLATALACETSTLQVLRLAGNGLQEDTLGSLIDSLQYNRSLRHLDLCGNALDNQGLKRLCSVLSQNNDLQSLNVKQNAFDAPDLLRQLLVENYSLTCLEHSMAKDHELQYLLKLNQGGRRLLRRERVPLGIWSFAFSMARGNFDSIYYLLRNGPVFWGQR